MPKTKILASSLIAAIILTFIYVGNFPAPSDLENEVMDYLGMTVQAATTSGVTLSATVASVLTVTVDSSTAGLGTLTPGTPIYSSTTASLNGNNATGYNLKVNRNNAATSTLTLGGSLNATNTIPDYTVWDSTGSGNANASPGATMSFRLRSTESTAACFSSTYWGTDGGTPLYAGFPMSATATSTTFNCSSFQSGTSTAKHYYRLDAPASQYTGAYSGGITLTATSNP